MDGVGRPGAAVGTVVVGDGALDRVRDETDRMHADVHAGGCGRGLHNDQATADQGGGDGRDRSAA